MVSAFRGLAVEFVSCAFVISLILTLLSLDAFAQDRIRFFDRAAKKEALATGAIQEETSGHIAYKLGTSGAIKEISGPDVLDVTYEMPGANKLDYSRATGEERKALDVTLKEADRKKALGEAIKDYEAVLPKLAGDRYQFIRRHLQFKIGRLLARQAEDDASQTDAAITALAQFLKDNPSSWQVVQCARLLAKLQLAKGDTDSARRTYEQLAATPEIPNDIKQECDLRMAEALILGKKFADAEKRLQVLLKTLAGDEAQGQRIRIYLAQCMGASGKLPEAIAQLDGIINKTADKDLKALAYNAMGDCYRLNGKTREALWPYLWVDVIYHQDKQQHVKAMEQLAKIFDEQGEKARAKQYRERLQKEER
jgi:tetratricopeptide (TPR) repeat protein